MGKDGKHALIGDIDGTEEQCRESYRYLKENYDSTFLIVYRTPNGLHFITGYRGSLPEITMRLFGVPNIDVAFIAQGVKRSYYFLENRVPIPRYVFEVSGVTPMRIERVA